MDLSDFKALVDAESAPGTSEPIEGSKAQLAEVQACFTAEESDQAFSDVRELIDDLGLRELCDQDVSAPYLDVAHAIQQALGGGRIGQSKLNSSDWQGAVKLGLRYASQNPCRLPPEQRWLSNARVSKLSFAIRRLKDKKYSIKLPATGGIEVPDSTEKRLVSDIKRLMASLGHSLAWLISREMANAYNSTLGRYNLGRPGLTVQLNAVPELPLAYLYQLSLRFFRALTTHHDPATAFNTLTELVTDATALLDLTTTFLDIDVARPNDVVSILRKSSVYDAVFVPTQAKPAHVREYLTWMLETPTLANLKDRSGVKTYQVKRLADLLLDKLERANPEDFVEIDPVDAASALGIRDVAVAREILVKIFVHQRGANQNLSFPPRDTDVDAAFRPLLLAFDKIWMQPGPIGARAVANAALHWCKMAWPTKRFDDKALGPLFEVFVRNKLDSSGVCVHYGEYEHGQSKGQCDAVIETQNEIILIELKTKMLTRAARDGDEVTGLFDLAQAIVHPQAQALERHAVLRENGVLTLTEGDYSHSLRLQGREVLKVSITRGDLGSLHDRPFVQKFLRAGCVVLFRAIDEKQQQKLDKLNNQFKKLKAAADRAGEQYRDTIFPFERSWSLSVYHLLMLLEHTRDSESFSLELQRTRRVSTPKRDFYSDYVFVRELNS